MTDLNNIQNLHQYLLGNGDQFLKSKSEEDLFLQQIQKYSETKIYNNIGALSEQYIFNLLQQNINLKVFRNQRIKLQNGIIIPDITIELENKIIFVELKSLRYYNGLGNRGNQGTASEKLDNSFIKYSQLLDQKNTLNINKQIYIYVVLCADQINEKNGKRIIQHFQKIKLNISDNTIQMNIYKQYYQNNMICISFEEFIEKIKIEQLIQNLQKLYVQDKLTLQNIQSKPVIKWVGGKRQQRQVLFDNFPTKIQNYYEWFVGGGSVLIECLNRLDTKQLYINDTIYICDINYSLIQLYQTIKKQPQNLINFFKQINFKNTEKVYYENRILFNNLLLKLKSETLTDTENLNLVCLFIYLNKTGFRGMYRINANGFYNVPYGNYKNNFNTTDYIDEQNIYNLSRQLRQYNTIILQTDYQDMDIFQYTYDDLVYMDPPYYSENSKSFESYQEQDFNHKKFMYQTINGVPRFMMSNFDTQYIRKQFQHLKNIQFIEVETKQYINSKNPSQIAKEILIKNF